jgi:amino-acid N-acetyltransferase
VTDVPIAIEPATPDDMPDVLALLDRHGLPRDGVRARVATMVVARDRSTLVGVAALELYSADALLRSVAVDAGYQGQRIGHRLTEAALDMARNHGVATVFLLTTTAEGFFPRLGFEPISRADVPDSVRTSIEFQSACPASAIVMRKRLARAGG